MATYTDDNRQPKIDADYGKIEGRKGRFLGRTHDHERLKNKHTLSKTGFEMQTTRKLMTVRVRVIAAELKVCEELRRRQQRKNVNFDRYWKMMKRRYSKMYVPEGL